MTERVIDVRGLHKSYGDVEAVAGVDLHVDRGEVFALLGPNGAGKTTTVEILEGYRDRTDGDVSVLGHDPAKPEADLKRRIGIVLQSTGVDPYLTVRETVTLYAGFYPYAPGRGRGGRPRRAGREAGHAREQALGRPAAPARRGRGARGRPRAAVPRRADHRLRSERAPQRVGDREEPHLDRQDDLPDDPLHGRGPVPREPGRRDRRRFDRGGGHPGHPGGARSHADARSVPRPRGSTGPAGTLGRRGPRRRLDRDPDREPDEGRPRAHRLGARARLRLRPAGGHPAQPRGRLPRADRRRRRGRR